MDDTNMNTDDTTVVGDDTATPVADPMAGTTDEAPATEAPSTDEAPATEEPAAAE